MFSCYPVPACRQVGANFNTVLYIHKAPINFAPIWSLYALQALGGTPAGPLESLREIYEFGHDPESGQHFWKKREGAIKKKIKGLLDEEGGHLFFFRLLPCIYYVLPTVLI